MNILLWGSMKTVISSNSLYIPEGTVNHQQAYSVNIANKLGLIFSHSPLTKIVF